MKVLTVCFFVRCTGMERVGWGDVPVLALETVGADCFNQAVKAAKLVTLPAITRCVILILY